MRVSAVFIIKNEVVGMWMVMGCGVASMLHRQRFFMRPPYSPSLGLRMRQRVWHVSKNSSVGQDHDGGGGGYWWGGRSADLDQFVPHDPLGTCCRAQRTGCPLAGIESRHCCRKPHGCGV